ncbi:MAG TPA: CPBP family intramembrane glutamic endopeptidase [Gemmatimonadaceae bacterium]|nr:CPBP family intramembrane glutamic endopeptidase [Gemmatimonadaceae bacterium]
MSSQIFFTTAGSIRAPWRLLFFVVAFIACSFFAMGLVSPLVGGAFAALGLGSVTFASIVEVVAAIAATALALRWLERKPWSEVGLDLAAARPKTLGVGFMIGAIAIAIPILLLIAVGWLDRVPASSLGWGHPLVRMTVLLLPAALAEELITRGYILTALRDAVGWSWAVALTSVGFGLLHLQNAGADVRSVTLVTLAGVFLAVVRIATASLYAAWMAHFAWNWVMAAIFHAPVSGFAFDVPAYRYVDAGPDWATGGTWGPEGGVPAGLAMITGTGFLLLRLRRRSRLSS